MRGTLRVLSLLVAAWLLAACGQPEPWRQESYVFGTRVEVVVVGNEAERARSAIAAVLREFDRLHQNYHAWQPSQLSALNSALAAGRPWPVEPELAALIRDAQQLTAQGEGLFDPGIGRLIALWGFQSEEFKAELPDPAALAAWQRERPGIADLEIGAENQVRSHKRLLALDFGGYLKGVALDRAAAILREQGIKDALINIGGNVIALGSKDGRPWRVGIQHPRQPGPLATLELHDGEAIGTSGDYQRFFELAGKRYSHLLDPLIEPLPRDVPPHALLSLGAQIRSLDLRHVVPLQVLAGEFAAGIAIREAPKNPLLVGNVNRMGPAIARVAHGELSASQRPLRARPRHRRAIPRSAAPAAPAR
jgi:thiamine biosynthesis lipoprotein